MVAAAAFPVAKLGILLVKQISKPLANSITNRAKKSRVFREYFCIPMAQFFHWADVKIRMRILNLGKVQTVPKLDTNKAIETGAQIFSEFIILFVASGAIFFEYRRSALKEEAKAAVVEKEKEDMKNRVIELELSTEKQTTQIRELTKLIIALRDDIHKTNGSGFFKSGKKEPEPLPPELAATLEDTPADSNSNIVIGIPKEVAWHPQMFSDGQSRLLSRHFSPVMADVVFVKSYKLEEI